MNLTKKLALAIGGSILAALSVHANSVTEVGVLPGTQDVYINSSLGTNLHVYAGVVVLNVDGVTTNSFCIDPYQWSNPSPDTSYAYRDLAAAPIPGNAMGAASALTIEELWNKYYVQALGSSSIAAGLQIAIWETVAKGTNEAFSVNGSDFGAAGMISNLGKLDGPADLIALSSEGHQDYVVQRVPDGGTTIAMLGLALLGLGFVRRRLA